MVAQPQSLIYSLSSVCVSMACVVFCGRGESSSSLAGGLFAIDSCCSRKACAELMSVRTTSLFARIDAGVSRGGDWKRKKIALKCLRTCRFSCFTLGRACFDRIMLSIRSWAFLKSPRISSTSENKNC